MADNRQCGDCTLCCKLMVVKELNKPANKWCELVQIGKGCGDYENRPKSCRGFECMWLQGALPEEWKPNKMHVVMWEHGAENRIMIHIDPHYPDIQSSDRIKRIVDTFVDAGVQVVVVEGDKRKLYASNLDQIPATIREKIGL